jgi:hypothetical protein
MIAFANFIEMILDFFSSAVPVPIERRVVYRNYAEVM